MVEVFNTIKEALLTYRQALRDWAATADFPETRPTLGE
jgi:hypothetical protein